MSRQVEIQWYLHQKGKRRRGPLSDAELRELADTGKILPADYLWHEGLDEYVQASKFPDLLQKPVHPTGSHSTEVPGLTVETRDRAVPQYDDATAASRRRIIDAVSTKARQKATVRDDLDEEPDFSPPSRSYERSEPTNDSAEEQINNMARDFLGQGSIKPKTILYVVLGFIVPFWPISMIFFWYLAYRSYKS